MANAIIYSLLPFGITRKIYLKSPPRITVTPPKTLLGSQSYWRSAICLSMFYQEPQNNDDVP